MVTAMALQDVTLHGGEKIPLGPLLRGSEMVTAQGKRRRETGKSVWGIPGGMTGRAAD